MNVTVDNNKNVEIGNETFDGNKNLYEDGYNEEIINRKKYNVIDGSFRQQGWFENIFSFVSDEQSNKKLFPFYNLYINMTTITID